MNTVSACPACCEAIATIRQRFQLGLKALSKRICPKTIIIISLKSLTCPPSFLCWLGLKHGCDWGKQDNHAWLWSFNWWLHVMQKRISSDLVKLGKKVQPFKKNTPPLNLILWFPVMITWPPRVHHMLWKCVKEPSSHPILRRLSASVFRILITNFQQIRLMWVSVLNSNLSPCPLDKCNSVILNYYSSCTKPFF